jgi:hypothetical protein
LFCGARSEGYRNVTRAAGNPRLRQKSYPHSVRPSLERRVTLQYWHALCHASIASMNRDRLKRAAAFVAQLHRFSIASPHSWRRADSVGRDLGLADADLEQAICDAEQAGFIERRAGDEGLVLLTAKGRAAASR